MKNVFIVGGCGFAKECFVQLLYLSRADPDITVGGFLGHNHHKPDYEPLADKFICDISEYNFRPDDYAVIGAAYPLLRREIYSDLKLLNVKLFNLIPPGVIVSPFVELGEGNVFAPPCGPGPHVKIGNANVFNGDVIIGHDSQIGDFNFIGSKAQILGRCQLGDMNMIGSGAVLLPDSRIGSSNRITPLSAVYKGCKNGCYMHGNPALNVGHIDEV